MALTLPPRLTGHQWVEGSIPISSNNLREIKISRVQIEGKLFCCALTAESV